jgi:hypothetical protein
MRHATFIAAALAAIVAPFAALAADHTVFFAHDSARLTAEGRAVIDQAAADYRATGEAAVSLVGHTDTSGSAEYNMRLSERRARAVAEALEAAGVPASSMTAAWRGESEPAVATGDGVREPRNRRVEITIGAPAADVAPPATVDQVVQRLRIGIGPYLAYNFQEGDESWLAGANLGLTYNLTDAFSLSAEQAVFYTLDADDEGFGGRTALGAEYGFNPAGGVNPYVGANVGYTFADGSFDDDFFAGPELGLRSGPWEVKAAYDFMFDRDWDEGVAGLTASYNFGF